MKKLAGFTLVEMMVALFIGGLVLGGVMFTYLSMKVTTRDTMTIGELQETGRLALNILQRDIEQVGFWGTFYEASMNKENTITHDNPTNDCVGGINNGSFPLHSANSNFRSIYAVAVKASSNSALSCINNVEEETDVLQVKFLEGLQIPPNETSKNYYYFIAEQRLAQFRQGPISAASISDNATVWRYRHHVYYIAEKSLKINGKNLQVPSLMRKRLTPKSGMYTDTIMEGVEDIHYVFGLDTNNDNKVDTYKSIESISQLEWGNRGNTLTVQVFLLVRALTPDANLKVKNQKYTLGQGQDKREHTFNDNYRRALFTTTIRLNNVGENIWKM